MHAADELRTADSLYEPDLRSILGMMPGSRDGYSPEIEQRLSRIRAYVLHDRVPERIRVHFETARNLYLYAWFVYRFHMVAEQYVYATLELALRIHFYPPDGKTGDSRKATLRPLFDRARREGLLSNKKFTLSRQRAYENARRRFLNAALKRMSDEGLEELTYSEAEVIPTEDDYTFDALETWAETIPSFRNLHAHGTTSLWPNVLGAFEHVSEIVNQLFDPAGS